MKTPTELNAARAEKMLDKQSSFGGQVMSLRDFLASHTFVKKSTWVHYRSPKRGVILENPKVVYYLEREGERGSIKMTEVPKLIYDTYDIPVTLVELRRDKEDWELDQRRKAARRADSFGHSVRLDG